MMIFKQYYLGCLAHASYLVADRVTRTAVIVDPQRDIEQYVEDARREQLEIRHVFLTHFHADFVAGHVELRDRVGAKIYLGARAQAEYVFTAMKDDDVLEFGGVRLQVLETPGHSPESICVLVYDLEKNKQSPYAVLTGDTLFIGDVGRPDLRASLGWTAEELGKLLYDSIHSKILKLPDETLIYPAHGAGSMCGKNIGKETVSTMGVQRRYNYALQPMSREEFVAIVSADQPEAPAYFTYDAILNQKERPTLDKELERNLRPLDVETLLNLQAGGAQVLDVRDSADFAGAHLANSINIGLGGSFATWAGTLLNKDKEIVIVAEPGSEYEAAVRLGRIGFDHLAGYLKDGMEGVEHHPDLIHRLDRITATTLAEILEAEAPPFVLDVRTESEWNTRRIEGSVNIPLHCLSDRIQEIPLNRMVVVQCATGYRSCMAMSILRNNNVQECADLVGGIQAWQAARLEVASSAMH